MGKFTKLLILVVAAASVGVLANFSITNAYAADCGGVDFCGTLDFGPIAVAADATNTSHILGFYGEFYIEHPLYVSARQSPIGDPTDPADVQGAFLNTDWIIMRDADNNLIPGAAVYTEWVAVTPDEGSQLQIDGFRVAGSSGGFYFKMVKQIPTPEATAAFGLITVDHTATGDGTNDPIPISGTIEGWCG